MFIAQIINYLLFESQSERAMHFHISHSSYQLNYMCQNVVERVSHFVYKSPIFLFLSKSIFFGSFHPNRGHSMQKRLFRLQNMFCTIFGLSFVFHLTGIVFFFFCSLCISAKRENQIFLVLKSAY